jgi:hypothetical protein
MAVPGRRNPIPAKGSTDEHGRFVLPCLDGQGVVYARNPEGDFAGYTMIEGDDQADVTIVLQSAAAAQGRFVDAAGKPLSGMTVVYHLSWNGPDGSEVAVGSGSGVLTDDNGRYRISGLLVGKRCSLYAHSGKSGMSYQTTFDVKDDDLINLGSVTPRLPAEQNRAIRAREPTRNSP